MAYLYPWGNTQELNLDWIIQKIKDRENGGGSGADIEEIANVLVALTYRSANTYHRYDYAFYNGKLYRATANTTGVFNPADWLEVQLGNDVAILTRLVNALDASVTTLQGQMTDLDSDDVDNASNVTGDTVSDALDNLNTAINEHHHLQRLTQADLNDVVGEGVYYYIYGDAANIVNAPFPNMGTILYVFGVTASGVAQVAVDRTAHSLTRIAYRTLLPNDTPSPWRYLLTDDDLPFSIARGGTGANNAASARTNLGLGSASVENVVPIAKGGTGATTAQQAAINIGTLRCTYLYRLKTLTIDFNSYRGGIFWFVGKFGTAPVFRAFGWNGEHYFSANMGDSWSGDLTYVEGSYTLQVTPPDYCDGVVIQLIPLDIILPMTIT